ncbi:uncharacterized protein LOC117104264 [Anneissia japonica]|uniref:uncharacterized protein LOC117104264 n=1 Tax=Anneissia japonica TaxID=1529436 RepID=UPI00142574CA|nr:uncharacterized protein LOC117104264 [Anneissia japonica]
MSKFRKFYVVERFERRKRSNVGKAFSVGMVIEEGGNSVVPCYVNNEFVESEVESRLFSLAVGTKVFVTNVFGGSSFRVTEKSKVMTNVADFDINMEVVQEFISPKVVSLVEACGSPKKRRLSVRGSVMEIAVDIHCA